MKNTAIPVGFIDIAAAWGIRNGDFKDRKDKRNDMRLINNPQKRHN